MFFRFCKKLVRILGLACQFLLVASLLLLYILPFQVVSANTSGTSGSNQGTNNQSILGTVLPACASAARGVNLFLECAKQVTLAILIVGIIFVFIRIAYQSAAGLLSGGASAASIQQIQDLLGSLIVGIVLVGMPALIIQSIDPLGRIIAFNFLQEFNLGPNARLISIDRDPDVAGCSGLQLCVDGCTRSQNRNPKDVRKCVEGCKRKNSDESTEPCSKKCRDTITADGDMTQFLKECVHTMLTEPPKTQTGSSGNSNSGSGNSGGNSGNNPAPQPNPNAKGDCKAFDLCLAESNAGYSNNYEVKSGCGSCYRGVGTCIQEHASTCDCANTQYFILIPPEKFGDNAYEVNPDKAAAFKNCIEGG
jgi:hypothetical protein